MFHQVYECEEWGYNDGGLKEHIDSQGQQEERGTLLFCKDSDAINAFPI